MRKKISSIVYNRQGEFRLLWLYVPAVLIHGIAANWRPPILEVIWDMVFYKGLAYGLHHIGSFSLNHHFPMPPLYPLLISPGFFAPNYLAAEFIQSWINPAVYFLALYPAYRYARTILDPRQSAWVCLMYALYPSAVYTQWSMSENLAAPLAMWILILASRLLTDESPRMREGTWLGIAVACLALTRIFPIVFCAAVILWIAYRTARRNRYPAPILMAFSLSLTLAVTVWWLMGYLAYKSPSMVYANFNQQPLREAVSQFAPIFAAHWTGLWIEGGLLIAALLFVQWSASFFSFHEKKNESLSEIIQLVFFINLVLASAAAVYYTKRIGLEPWSVSLRYIFYANLASLPVAVSAMGKLRGANWRIRFAYGGLLAAAILLFSITFAISEAWQKLADSHAYFSNAPSLDFLYQIRNEGALTAFLTLAGISFVAGILFLSTRRVGAILLCIFLFYFQASAMEHLQMTRARAIREQDVVEIHDFCKQLELGKWKDVTIYCEEGVNYPHLIPNLIYWVQRGSGNLPPEDPRPPLPYLLLTKLKHADGEQVFESGELRAYLFEKK